MAIDREAAKAAGYSDAEIDAFEAEQLKKDSPTEYVPKPPPPEGTIPEISQWESGKAAIGLNAANFLSDPVKTGLGALATAGAVSLAGKPLLSKAMDLWKQYQGSRVTDLGVAHVWENPQNLLTGPNATKPGPAPGATYQGTWSYAGSPPPGGAAAAPGATGPVPPTQPVGMSTPMAQRAAAAVKGLNKALIPLTVASELFYTSPEERKQLQEMERTHTTLKDWTKRKLGINQPIAPGQE